MFKSTYHQLLRRTLAWLLLLVALLGPSLSYSIVGGKNPNALPPPPVLLVVGDSLSSGHGLKEESGWVDLLSRKLKANQYDYVVVNASMSGDTSSNGLTKLPDLLSEHRPKILILELGANDGLRGIKIEEIKDNLEQSIRLAIENKAEVLLVGTRVPPSYGISYATNFNHLFKTLAQQQKVLVVPDFIDTVEQDYNLLQKDRFHPNENAQLIMLERIWPKLKLLLDIQSPKKH